MHSIPKNPRQKLLLAIHQKEAGLFSGGLKAIKNLAKAPVKGMSRTGGNLLDYGTKLIKNPIKTLKHNAATAGATVRDKEKQFDVMENALENLLRKKKKVSFAALNEVDPSANIAKRGVQKLRQEGLATAGRRTQGTVSDASHAKIVKQMRKKGLLHESKGGVMSIHRDADVGELRKIYDKVQGLDVSGKANLLDRARNKLNYVPLPGERGVLGLGIASGVATQMADKETKTGRKRGLAERLGRAGVMTAAELAAAPIGIANRLYGGLGMGAEMGLTMGTEALLNKNSKKARGVNIQAAPALNIPGAPGSMQKQAQKVKSYSVKNRLKEAVNPTTVIQKNPRARLRRALK